MSNQLKHSTLNGTLGVARVLSKLVPGSVKRAITNEIIRRHIANNGNLQAGSAEFVQPESSRNGVSSPQFEWSSDLDLINKINSQYKSLDELPAIAQGLDRVKYALALKKYHNYPKAIQILESVPLRDRNYTIHKQLSDSYFALANMEKAEENIDCINADFLTEIGECDVLMSRANIFVHTGRFQKALSLLQKGVDANQSYVPLALKYGSVLYLSGDEEGALEFASDLYAEHALNGPVINFYTDILFKVNQLGPLKSLLHAIQAREPNNRGIDIKAARLAWALGDHKWLAKIIDKFDRGKLYNIEYASFIAEISSNIDFVADAKQRIKMHLDANAEKMKAVDEKTLAWRLNQMGQACRVDYFELAEYCASIVIEKFPFISQAWSYRGFANLCMDNWQQAEADLEKALKLNPANLEAHNSLFSLRMLGCDDPPRLQEGLKFRNESLPKFKQVLPDGRMPFYDMEQFKLSMRHDCYASSIECRNNQPPNRLLGKAYGEKYRTFIDKAFSTKKTNSVAVIGQDGVADEVRWSQYYSELRKHFSSVSVSCEPRLQSIFERSFPDYNFVPIQRRWPFTLATKDMLRPEIPEVNFGAKITKSYFDFIGKCDEVMFVEEVAYRTWKTNGVEGPDDAGCGNGRYLLPKPEREEYWKGKLHSEFGNSPKIGILWRSSLRSQRRNVHYLEVEDILRVVQVGKDCNFINLQHKIEPHERHMCIANGVRIYDEVDLFNDFEEIAALGANLDLVIGISSLPYELAVAVGTPGWVYGVSAEGRYNRLGASAGNRDKLSWNSRVFCGDDPEKGFMLPKVEIVNNVTKQVSVALQEALATGKYL
jgi:tetratricopeptide (TPR) repeat protein